MAYNRNASESDNVADMLRQRRAARAVQSPDAPKPDIEIEVTAPRVRPRAAPRRASGPSEADRLNDTSLALARGRQGPLAPGAETNIGRRMGYSKGGMVCPGRAGRAKPL